MSFLQVVKKKYAKSKLQASLANTELYYHGTTSIFGKKILKDGFRPNPTSKVWDQTKRHLESFSGTYFSNSLEVAGRAAAAAVAKYKGEMWIFQVNLNPDVGYLDEDELPPMDVELRRLELDDEDDRIDGAVDLWLESYQDRAEPLSAPIKKKLIPLLKLWAGGEVVENYEDIKDAKNGIIKVLKGHAHKLGQNLKMLKKVPPSSIVSLIEFNFSKGKLNRKVIYGSPRGYFLEDLNALQEDEISTWKELYF